MEYPAAEVQATGMNGNGAGASNGAESSTNKVLERWLQTLGSVVTEEAATSLRHLAAFRSATSPNIYPKRKMAGVLILLHINELGGLSVTLTTRSLRLRSHPGETALPGGRHEEADESIEATALREANEEIGLPLGDDSLIHLATLPAYSSRTLLVVIPSVYVLTTVPAAPLLASLVPNPDEVDAIFHLPLKAFLSLTKPPRSTRAKPHVDAVGAEVLAHSFEDMVWLEDRLYRLHRFEHPTVPSPVWGLTADILVATALVAHYGLTEDEEVRAAGTDGKLGFGRWADGQMPWSEIVQVALAMHGEKGLSDKRTSAT